MNLFLAAVALSVAITACSNDDDNAAVDNNDPVAARITAGLGTDVNATPDAKASQPVTRAVDDHWNSDHIGVIAFAPSSSNMVTQYRNAHYVTTSTGADAKFTPASAEHTIYFSGPDEEVSFAAYAPYQSSATPGTLPGANGVISIDTRKQADATEQEALDFLFATGATASKSNPTVAFSKVDDAHDYSFRHIMTRLVLNIVTPADNGFSPDDVKRISRISLGGLRTSGSLDIVAQETGATYTLSPDAATRTDDWDIAGYVYSVGPDKNGVTQRVHTLIFFPQEAKNNAGTALSAVPIAITLDGEVYKNTKDITNNNNTADFKSGYSYEYTICLRKRDLEVTAATITPWADGGKRDGDAIIQ